MDLSRCSEAEVQQAVDSFCTVYFQVIRDKGDGKIVASEGVKKRILANERNFRDLCVSKPK